MMKEHPTVSIIIPTLNSARTLPFCLDSIKGQDYPTASLEVIFIDGGSSDATEEVIREFELSFKNGKVLLERNPLKTGEAGKAVGLKKATGEIVAFIDSDNILEEKDWLKRMTQPFGQDPLIVASEPIAYTYRSKDSFMTRYCALLGMNDPLCYFLGNYDRKCLLSGHWTEMPFDVLTENGSYQKIKLDASNLPTMGANGFLVRKRVLADLRIGDYLFDIDLLPSIFEKNPSFCVAKVEIGIIHLFTSSFLGFFKKQARRVGDYRRYGRLGLRRDSWKSRSKAGLVYFCASCLFLLPLMIQAVRGFSKKADLCWLAHPVACLITFWSYLLGFIFPGFGTDRSRWQMGKEGSR